MRVSELIEILKEYPQDADLIIETSNGFVFLDDAIEGVFELTDYGNDFFPHEKMCIRKAETSAVCLFPIDDVDTDDRTSVAPHKPDLPKGPPQ